MPTTPLRSATRLIMPVALISWPSTVVTTRKFESSSDTEFRVPELWRILIDTSSRGLPTRRRGGDPPSRNGTRVRRQTCWSAENLVDMRERGDVRQPDAATSAYRRCLPKQSDHCAGHVGMLVCQCMASRSPITLPNPTDPGDSCPGLQDAAFLWALVHANDTFSG